VLRLVPSIQRNDAPLYLYYCNETKCVALQTVLQTVVERFAASRELCAFFVRAQYRTCSMQLMDGSHSPGIINESIKSNHEQKPASFLKNLFWYV
jgi:hypothetical protein